MAAGFIITYAIDPSEWERTAAARWNPETEPVYDCFYGDVHIDIEGELLFGPEPFNISVADLACGLALILQSEISLVGTHDVATFRQSDDSLEIVFERLGDRVQVSSNAGRGESGVTTVGAFLEGTRDFIKRFARDVAAHVPEALTWEELSILWRYAE